MKRFSIRLASWYFGPDSFVGEVQVVFVLQGMRCLHILAGVLPPDLSRHFLVERLQDLHCFYVNPRRRFLSHEHFRACGIGMDAYKKISLLTIGNLGSLKKLDKLIGLSV